jgi:hypothetical protein
VYVWPLANCPSSGALASGQKAFFTNIASLLLGNVVSGLVGIPASALNAAAEADKAGFTMTGTNARYYYTVEEVGQGKVATAIPPACYVVAMARPVSSPTPWCDDPGFKTGVAQTCTNGSKVLDGLSGLEQLKDPAPTSKQNLSVPEFYAEIEFYSAGYGAIVRPALTALYYPDSLLQKKSKKPRAISLTIVTTSPLKDDPFKAASIAINLLGIVPAPVQPKDKLLDVRTGWTSVPTFGSKDSPTPEVGKPFLPVTMAASIHEVGAPSVFLASFAKAFSGSAADYTKAVTSELLPASIEAAQRQDATNDADYNAKVAAAKKSVSEYLAACAKLPATAPNPITLDYQASVANAENLWYSIVANKIKANVAAQVAGSAEPFPNTMEDKKCWPGA